MSKETSGTEGGGQVNTNTAPETQAQQAKPTLTGDAKSETEKSKEQTEVKTDPKPIVDEGKKDEAKPEDKKVEDKKAEDKKVEDKAPEKYEKFSVPEGLEIDTDTLGKFESMAKELNLSQEKAQKLIDISTANTQKELQKQYDNHLKQRETWVSELRADAEFGGEKFNETVDRAKRSLRKFGSEPLIKFLEFSGYGDNGDLIKMLAKIDKAISEDSAVDGDATGTQAKSAAATLYPNQNKGKG